jgi:hypothetical protein
MWRFFFYSKEIPIMDVQNDVPTIGQLIGQVKTGCNGQVIQSPFRDGLLRGWIKVWKNEHGEIWSQIKIDNGEDCPLLEPKLEIPAKPKKPRKPLTYNPFGNRWKKKVKVVGHI